MDVYHFALEDDYYQSWAAVTSMLIYSNWGF